MKAVSVIFLAITLCYVVAVDLKQLDLKLRDLKEHDLGERDLEKMERELMERTAGDGIQPMQQCETEDGTYSHNQLIPHKDPCATCYCHNGGEICLMVMCAYPMCVDRNMQPDVCCDTCPNGDNCWLDGEIVSADRPVIQKDGLCTRYCSCPRSMAMYRRYEEKTFAHCIVHCEEEEHGPEPIVEEPNGPAIGHGQVEPELPFTEMFNNMQGR